MALQSASDPVDAWLGDSKTKGSRRAILNRFFECNETTAAELLKVGGALRTSDPQTEIQKKLDHYVKVRKDLGIARSTITKDVGAIIAFFGKNKIFIEAPKRLSPEPRYEPHKLLEKSEVMNMLEAVKSEPEKQAVILTLAQTGQPLRVLTALSWEAQYKRLAVINEWKGWGVVRIKPENRTWLDETFNRANVNYTFFIHPESLKVLHKIQVPNEKRVFTIHPRQIQRIVGEAALKADVQEDIRRRINGAKCVWHHVHSSVFQRYWKETMHFAGIDSELVKYLMGRKVTSAPSEDHLVKVYEKARTSLSLIS